MFTVLKLSLSLDIYTNHHNDVTFHVLQSICTGYLVAIYTMGWNGVHFPSELRFFLLATTFRLALGPTQPLIQGVLGVLSPEVKLLGYKTDHSLPSSAVVKNARSYSIMLH
jgi:hypothetical protein